MDKHDGVNDEEKQEILDVIEADACTNPAAMVIEAGDTAVAQGAVLGTGQLW